MIESPIVQQQSHSPTCSCFKHFSSDELSILVVIMDAGDAKNWDWTGFVVCGTCDKNYVNGGEQARDVVDTYSFHNVDDVVVDHSKKDGVDIRAWSYVDALNEADVLCLNCGFGASNSSFDHDYATNKARAL